MHTEEITDLLSDLAAGAITWQQALTQVTALPTAWQTPEWKRRRDALIGSSCAVCETTDGPFVLQHLLPTPTFKEVCQAVKAELRADLLVLLDDQVSEHAVAEHVGPGDERPACPTCGSVSIRERQSLTPRYLCSRGERGYHSPAGFDAPVPVRYYAKQKTTNREVALATAREFLLSVAVVAELRRRDDRIQHEATLRSLKYSLAYRSLQHTATYCKKCAFKADLPLIKRKQYA
ncbi:hypothetical protein FNT36_24820 [Hymenobacter setariae]|uniref:Uncharacterized protein n=1 Tax=Hymenobacter setariae TaxID=2594794 RepID=A0A558BJP9_9BACT|nr:hypothetical protein [Hymenobacter setariae]TVT36739.1 hypothetical protein FNT36_24820 [Hymenobacter setariae]